MLGIELNTKVLTSRLLEAWQRIFHQRQIVFNSNVKADTLALIGVRSADSKPESVLTRATVWNTAGEAVMKSDLTATDLQKCVDMLTEPLLITALGVVDRATLERKAQTRRIAELTKKATALLIPKPLESRYPELTHGIHLVSGGDKPHQLTEWMNIATKINGSIIIHHHKNLNLLFDTYQKLSLQRRSDQHHSQ